MINIQSSEESYADDIVEAVAYEASLPKAKKFLPWHRPRKQYVRHHQWCEEIEHMLNDAPLAYGTLRYLGLPGVDLLDLRHFHTTFCEPRNINLRFLGFNDSAKPLSDSYTELNISLDEVRRLSHVDPMSDMIGDNFAWVAKEDSFACQKALALGPYDVINLDLCDGFGAQVPGELNNNYYDAVNSLLALQARTKNPWLLFLTTRADKQNVNDGVLERLLCKYIDNLMRCSSFREASREKFSIETEEALRSAVKTPDGLLSIFLTSLCKWFLGLALAHQPPTLVELRSVIGYRVKPSAMHEDLVSLALRFTPTIMPADDPLGLANQSKAKPSECTLSTDALKKVAERIDADRKLMEDADLNQNMIEAMVELLSCARYDIGTYRDWLQTAQPSIKA